jgi:hypothetical protein
MFKFYENPISFEQQLRTYFVGVVMRTSLPYK